MGARCNHHLTRAQPQAGAFDDDAVQLAGQPVSPALLITGLLQHPERQKPHHLPRIGHEHSLGEKRRPPFDRGQARLHPGKLIGADQIDRDAMGPAIGHVFARRTVSGGSFVKI